METKEQQMIDTIVSFWFEDLDPKKRFEKDEALDARIIEEFQDTYQRIIAGETVSWRETPEGRLAEIIVLDQFARNMFRGSPQSFTADELSLRLAKEAVVAGDDMKLPKEKRAFIYMPYMHSESKEMHEKSLALFTKLGNEEFLKHARMHKGIVDRFERYPHRNEVLERESSPEEIEFLKDNPGF